MSARVYTLFVLFLTAKAICIFYKPHIYYTHNVLCIYIFDYYMYEYVYVYVQMNTDRKRYHQSKYVEVTNVDDK